MAKEPKVKAVVLLKNYRPAGEFKVTSGPGYLKTNKVMAGSTVELPKAEAKDLVEDGLAEYGESV